MRSYTFGGGGFGGSDGDVFVGAVGFRCYGDSGTSGGYCPFVQVVIKIK